MGVIGAKPWSFAAGGDRELEGESARRNLTKYKGRRRRVSRQKFAVFLVGRNLWADCTRG